MNYSVIIVTLITERARGCCELGAWKDCWPPLAPDSVIRVVVLLSMELCVATRALLVATWDLPALSPFWPRATLMNSSPLSVQAVPHDNHWIVPSLGAAGAGRSDQWPLLSRTWSCYSIVCMSFARSFIWVDYFCCCTINSIRAL